MPVMAALMKCHGTSACHIHAFAPSTFCAIHADIPQQPEAGGGLEQAGVRLEKEEKTELLDGEVGAQKRFRTIYAGTPAQHNQTEHTRASSGDCGAVLLLQALQQSIQPAISL
jgi:hypothetical protein